MSESEPKLKSVETPDQDKKPSPEELKALILADRKAREQRAAERIKEVLEEEQCMMNPVMILTSQGISSRIEITAAD